MNPLVSKTLTFLRRTLQWVSFLAVSLVLVFALLAVSINIPAVQTLLVQRLTNYLTEQLKYPIQVRFVDIGWFDTLILNDVEIKDVEGNDMIYVRRLKVRFNLQGLLSPTVEVASATVEEANVRLENDAQSHNVNINAFIEAINTWTGATGDTTDPGAPFQLKRAHVINSRFSYFDETTAALDQPFDYYHFQLDSINGTVDQFMLHGDTVQLDMSQLTCVHAPSKLRIKSFDTFFRTTRHSLEFYKLNLAANNTRLKRQIVFRFRKFKDFSDIYHKIDLNARLDSSIVDLNDIYLFSPQLLEGRHERLMVSGNIAGTIANYKGTQMRLWMGEKTYMAGTVAMEGLPTWTTTAFSADLRNSYIHPPDLLPYVGANGLELFKHVTFIKPDVLLEGFPTDFSLIGKLESNLGQLKTDVHLSLNDNPDKSKYVGKVSTKAFDLGGFIGDRQTYQLIDLDGQINGTGFDAAKARFDLKAKVARIGVLGYNYRNILADGHYQKRQSNFNVAVADSNITGVLAGAVNLVPGDENISITARLDRSNPARLKLIPGLQLLAGEFDVDFNGLTFDSFDGTAQVDNLQLNYEGRYLAAGHVGVDARQVKGVRTLEVDSDLAKLNLEGTFTYGDLISDLEELFVETRLAVTNNQGASRRQYRSKKYNAVPYTADLTLTLLKPRALTRLLTPDWQVAANTQVEANFVHGRTEVFQATVNSDTLEYRGHKLWKPNLDIALSKPADTSSIVAGVSFYSTRQQFVGFEPTGNLRASVNWQNQEITYNGSVYQLDSVNGVDLAGIASFFPDHVENRITSAHLRLLDRPWQVDSTNLITFRGGKALVDHLALRSEEQLLAAAGTVGPDPGDTLQLALGNLGLAPLSLLAGEAIAGVVNGHLELASILGQFSFGGNLRIDSLGFDNVYVGDLVTQVTWDEIRQKPALDGTLFRSGERAVSLAGFLNFASATDQLELTAQLRNTSLQLLTPFLQDIVSELQGTANGRLSITGRFAEPQLNGAVVISRASVLYPYLGARFQMQNQQIEILPRAIVFDGVELLDPAGNRAFIEKGKLYHRNFQDWGADFDLRLTEFQILNTPPTTSELYYGTVNVSGVVGMHGPFDNFNITASVYSARGTKLSIPLTGESTTSGSEYSETSQIRFVNKTMRLQRDTSQRDSATVEVPKLDLSGVRLDFNLDINELAEIEIIFDPRAGEIMRGTGNGKLKLALDTRGEFTLLGQYELERGTYNFTFYDVINKRFDVTKGSTITWTGDPLEAVLDVRANHRVYASLTQLIDASDSLFLARPEVRRKYPATVRMHLTGPLMTPRVGLDIDIRDYPSILEPYVAPFKARIAVDEQELNKQVTSLFLFRQFLPENNAASGLNTAGGRSVSELLSNQLSQYLSQVSDNLQVDIDVNGLDQAAINTLQLRLSYSLLEGRLRVTREGGFTNVQNQATTSTIAGDWTVEYLLSRDGVFRVKMFHKNNQNVITVGLNNNATTSSGFSLMHTQSFNTLRELFRGKAAGVPEVEPSPTSPTNVGRIIHPQDDNTPPAEDAPALPTQPAAPPTDPNPNAVPDTQ